MHSAILNNKLSNPQIMTFIAITLFYFFESVQMGYFNVLAPSFLNQGIYNHQEIGSLSAAYVYGCMFGLIPVGYALDRYPLRKILLWAIFGSVIAAFLLLISQNFLLQWIARFLCGFFGGAFSFVGGIRVLSGLFPNRFTFFMGLFISAGMLGGLVCQYPLLIGVNRFGVIGGEAIVATFGVIVMLYSFLYLYPVEQNVSSDSTLSSDGFWQTLFLIIKNHRNWLDCLMVILLDTPVSIIGTLWGIIILMNFYHLTDIQSSWIVMALFVGLIIGSPIWGELADHLNYPEWIIIVGSFASFSIVLFLLTLTQPNLFILSTLFFGLGFFSSSQTLGFTWLTKNMRPDLIGRNSAFNSMLFMVTNGGFKQLGAYLLSIPPLLAFDKAVSASNLLILIAVCMLLTSIYALFRKPLFTKEKLSINSI